MTEGFFNQDGSFKKIQNYIFNFNDLLGKGNFSKVYKAHNEVTNEVVAIKIIELNSLKSKKLQQLLYSEIQILKKLNHPNVVKCFQVFTSSRNCYIITQLCNQGDLEAKFKHRKGLKQFEAQKYILDIYKGLIYLANNQIVHRDLKVANIFISNGSAKIADFGFAKVTKFKFKDANIGSPIYMSPQGLIDNVYGPKTDVWAFGILIYELLHGQTPFSHCKSQSQLKYNICIPIGWNQLKSQLSNDIKQVIVKCLQVDQNKRISALQLQELNFFKNKLYVNQNNYSSSFIRDKMGINNLNFGQWNNKTSLSKNNLQEVNRSLGNLDTIKHRIKTQSQFNGTKRTGRQYSGTTNGKSNFVRDSISPTYRRQKQPMSYVKLTQQHENSLKYSHKQSIQKYKTPQSLSLIQNSSKMMINTLKDNHKQNIILSSSITFKQCVNILHYCRLIFKHLIYMKQINFGDDNQINILKRWLSTILKILQKEIGQYKIMIQPENRQARQRKLQQVTNQYIKKYTKQLNLDLSKARLQQSLIINYQKIYNYFISIFQMIDQIILKQNYNLQMIELGHSMIIICYSTKIMKKCYDERRYQMIQKLKDVEQYLISNKSNHDFNSYIWYKKKYLTESGL